MPQSRMVTGFRFLAVLVGVGVAAPALAKDVPFVPTPQPVVDKMLELAQPKKGDYLIDLGSGDGRIVVTAAQRYGVTGMGVDIDPDRVAEGKENAKQAGVTDKATFVEADLFKTDISKADVLTMYLLPQVNLRLRPVVLDKLKPGTRVVSHAFDMGDWQPDQRESVESRTIYYWVVPAKAAGTWRLEQGGKTTEVSLDQTYQMLEGKAGGQKVEGRLRGTEVSLTMAGADGKSRTLTGKVEGGKMSGSGEGGAWTATRTGG